MSTAAAGDPPPAKPDPHATPPENRLSDSNVGGHAVQFGSARDVSIGAQLPARAPLPDATQTTAPPGLANLPRPPATVFVGREEVLHRIEQMLTAEADAGVITQTAVHGLGGIGKSELALQYAVRHRNRYRLVWWLKADSPVQIDTSLANLAQAICTGKDSVAASQATVEEAAAWARSWLVAHPGWLLVFDNVEQAKDIAPDLGRLSGGHVLITTRRDIGWHDLGRASINLDVLAPQAATDLLADLIRRPTTPAAADTATCREEMTELADDLGALPLALTQAGTFIARTGMTVSRYRRLLHQSPAKAYATVVPGQDSQQIVARVWAVTMARVAELNPLAPHVLSLMACYAPDDLPTDVLYGLPETDELEIAQALGTLASHSMITLTEEKISAHRLVQAVTWSELPEDRQPAIRDQAIALLTNILPNDPKLIGNWAIYARLLPHARTVFPPDSAAMARVIEYLHASGDYATAKTLQHHRYLAYSKTLGPDHPDTLVIRAYLAYWTGAAGDPTTARNHLVELLPIHQRVLGPEHPRTLVTRAYLAYWTGAAGDPTTARNLYADLLPIRQRISGPEHPDTLTAQADLARWTGMAGDHTSARDQLADLLPIRQRICGAEHPDTLTTRADLAYWTGAAGDHTSARDQFADLLPIMVRILGAGHPQTLDAQTGLSRWKRQADE
ncbi:tetratricopeptide repeat protein [Rhizohabitans arisaemae]|uniref:tetratricopeptide repeat protein n=1 Tax=Rhizohabitans arisaemae TaxID=2720610 RepID=UPI0024B217D2|nr:tetratricopeptide repeat protein [Rhizohabitans arisaemae]